MPNTQDAKQFLSERFPQPDGGGWKRIRKFKDEGGAWVREFRHATGKLVGLVEQDDGFAVHQPKLSPAAARFSAEEIDGARQLLEAFRINSDDPDSDEDEIEHHPLRRRYAHALPAIMSFYFPADTYHNDEANDNPQAPAREMCVVFFDTAQEKRDDAGYRYYYQWLLPTQAEAGMDRVDEVHHEIREDWGNISDAIEQDDAKTLANTLDAGVAVDTRMGDNASLLGLALRQDRKHCFDLLLARGATDADLTTRTTALLTVERTDPQRYALPLLRSAWNFNEKEDAARLTLGEQVLLQALGMAMDPIGKQVLPEVLELCQNRADARGYAKAFFQALACHLVAQRNPTVRIEIDRLLGQHPGIEGDKDVDDPSTQRGFYPGGSQGKMTSIFTVLGETRD